MKTTFRAWIPTFLTAALRNAISSTANALLFASCASAPTIVHDSVGPAVVRANNADLGSLMVYSATAWTTGDDEDSPGRLRHTDYDINAPDGKLFGHVTNADEEPSRVSLPSGNYSVVAQSDTARTVVVPVVIRTGRTTVVHLEREKDWDIARDVGNVDLVRLPNGQPIGFRAGAAEPLKSRTVIAAQMEKRVSSTDQ
jgi:hypothetical protein